MNKLDTALELYDKTFDGSFPTIPLLMENSDEKVVEIINKCISENKDVYDMGYLSLDSEVIY
ncbi:MAG: hypothetical protein RSD88_02720 [Anaerovoracaceae bacterium]